MPLKSLYLSPTSSQIPLSRLQRSKSASLIKSHSQRNLLNHGWRFRQEAPRARFGRAQENVRRSLPETSCWWGEHYWARGTNERAKECKAKWLGLESFFKGRKGWIVKYFFSSEKSRKTPDWKRKKPRTRPSDSPKKPRKRLKKSEKLTKPRRRPRFFLVSNEVIFGYEFMLPSFATFSHFVFFRHVSTAEVEETYSR